MHFTFTLTRWNCGIHISHIYTTYSVEWLFRHLGFCQPSPTTSPSGFLRIETMPHLCQWCTKFSPNEQCTLIIIKINGMKICICVCAEWCGDVARAVTPMDPVRYMSIPFKLVNQPTTTTKWFLFDKTSFDWWLPNFYHGRMNFFTGFFGMGLDWDRGCWVDRPFVFSVMFIIIFFFAGEMAGPAVDVFTKLW